MFRFHRTSSASSSSAASGGGAAAAAATAAADGTTDTVSVPSEPGVSPSDTATTPPSGTPTVSTATAVAATKASTKAAATSTTSTTATMVAFKQEKSFDKRKAESERIRAKYPDLIPVICERHIGNTTLPQSTRRKYLVPPDITMGQFLYVIRKRIELLPDQALYVFVKGTVMCPTMTSVSEAYRMHRDPDGFLYMVYSGESTFG